MISTVLSMCGWLISAYSFVCFIRIILTWMPQFSYTPAGQFLAAFCDPYLNLFRRFSFTRFGAIDLSPFMALVVLSVASITCKTLAFVPVITITGVLAVLIRTSWNLFVYIPFFLILLLAIRLVYDLFNRYGYSAFWTTLDRLLNPVISRVTRFFNRGRTTSYRVSLILSLLVVLILTIAANFAVDYICNFLGTLPV